LDFSTFILFFGRVSFGHPLNILKHFFLYLVRECVGGIFCKFGEFALCRCEDIARLRYEKFVLSCGFLLFPSSKCLYFLFCKVVLNSLQSIHCKFCSVEFDQQQSYYSYTASNSFEKTSIYLNDQNVTQAVNFQQYFFNVQFESKYYTSQ